MDGLFQPEPTMCIKWFYIKVSCFLLSPVAEAIELPAWWERQAQWTVKERRTVKQERGEEEEAAYLEPSKEESEEKKNTKMMESQKEMGGREEETQSRIWETQCERQ